MDTAPHLPLHLFDEEAELQIVERRLPHWSQTGTVCFVTWRTVDSMPKAVLDSWNGDRSEWLRAHGVDPAEVDWQDRLIRLGPDLAREFFDTFWNRWHDSLDECHGACVLGRPDLATIVADSLRHFDGERYMLLEFVVMPNHVHLLAAFADEEAMLAQCESWKHFTATRINRVLGRKGRFWQPDAFDHLVRSQRQLTYLRHYIADNPKKAGLGAGQFVHYSKALRGLNSSSRGA
jgi:type I restriction enzyme R subunit